MKFLLPFYLSTRFPQLPTFMSNIKRLHFTKPNIGYRFLPIINFSCLLVWLSPSQAPVKLNNTLFHKNTEAPWSSLLLLLKTRKSEAQTQVVQVHKASLWKSQILPNNQLPVLFRDFFFNFTLWPQFGEGNGNTLQYSCLEKPMDRGAWRATVHGIAESRHN